jgi:hypothetical protein
MPIFRGSCAIENNTRYNVVHLTHFQLVTPDNTVGVLWETEGEELV